MRRISEKSTVQKSYDRHGELGVLDLLATRKVNKLRVVNTGNETDPD
jgi:hypothetical protein